MRPVRVDAAGLRELRALVLAAAGAGLGAGFAGPALAVAGPPSAPSAPGAPGQGWAFATVEGTLPTRLPAAVPGSRTAPDADAHARRMEALVELAQGGDGEAFAMIYDAYVDQVYRYIYFRCSDHALAEDLTSETFLRALRRLSSFTWQGRDIGAWFVTIARNLLADHYKSGRYRLELATADILDADRADDGIEDAVVEHLGNSELLAAVKALKPEQQECIVLRFLQGLSVAETAAVMGRSEGAIKQLQLRAVRALARSVDPSLR